MPEQRFSSRPKVRTWRQSISSRRGGRTGNAGAPGAASCRSDPKSFLETLQTDTYTSREHGEGPGAKISICAWVPTSVLISEESRQLGPGGRLRARLLSPGKSAAFRATATALEQNPT